MKALTLHQPWASLIAFEVKTIETRSWSTKYRGPLAIHAGLSQIGAGECSECWDALRAEVGWTETPLGAVVATCTLVDVVPTDSMADLTRITGGEFPCIDLRDTDWMDEHEPMCDYGGRTWDLAANRPYGDFTSGRFAWLLADIVPLDPPVPAKGRQGLWEWTP